MYVVKRDGRHEKVAFEKITARITKLCTGLNMEFVEPVQISIKVINGIFPGVTTVMLDNLAAETAAYLTTAHSDYAILAARIAVSNLHKQTKKAFSETIVELFHHVNPKTLKKSPMISTGLYETVMANRERIDSAIVQQRDFQYSYFGFKTLEKSYLLKIGNVIAERPQYMLMRVALGIHGNDIDKAIETYELMSQKFFTHASPTLFNAGTITPQLSSCFLLTIQEDSIEGIYDTLKQCALISKTAGGIGINIHKIRATGSTIYATNGKSNGLVPMLQNFNSTARYVDQGGNKRPGAFAIYLEPWHADIFDFLDLKKNTGKEERRARDLFYSLWIPDLFMKRVEENGDWSLFCPNEAKGLDDVWGAEFEKLYEGYEKTPGLARQTIKAQKLWSAILESQIETGTPYMLYKDAANSKSNQQNLGTIKCSNLCVAPETRLLTDKGHVPIGELEGKTVNVWNGHEWSQTVVVRTNEDSELVRVKLRSGAYIDCTPYHKFILKDGVTRVDAKDLKRETKLCEWEFDGISVMPAMVDEVEKLERRSATFCVNEPLRHAAVFNGTLTGQCTEVVQYSSPEEVAVCNLASICLPAFFDRETGAFDFSSLHKATQVVTRNLNKIIDINYYPIPEARRSNLRHRPVGLGVQGLADLFMLMRYPFDDPRSQWLNKAIFETIYHAALTASCQLAEIDGPYETYEGSPVSKGILQFDMWGVPTPTNQWDWAGLREQIKRHGVRNSLLVAPMPTASTAQILGNNESFEPYTSNIYTRRVLSGEFQIVNQHLVKHLIELGLWSDGMKNKIIAANGSVMGIEEIPSHVRDIYKTVWEISQKVIIDMAADRGAFIDQSQSLNIHMKDANFGKLTSMHFYGWKKGLKTGMYYLRTKAAVDAIKFTVDKSVATGGAGVTAAAVAASPKKVEKSKLNNESFLYEPLPSSDGEVIRSSRSSSDVDKSAEELLCARENKEACTMCSS